MRKKRLLQRLRHVVNDREGERKKGPAARGRVYRASTALSTSFKQKNPWGGGRENGFAAILLRIFPFKPRERVRKSRKRKVEKGKANPIQNHPNSPCGVWSEGLGKKGKKVGLAVCQGTILIRHGLQRLGGIFWLEGDLKGERTVNEENENQRTTT